MSGPSNRFIEDNHQDKEHLTATALRIHLNAGIYRKSIKRVTDLQEMLSLQQKRLHRQQLLLVELAENFMRQEQMMYESSQLLKDGRLPNSHALLERQILNRPGKVSREARVACLAPLLRNHFITLA